MSEEHAPYGHGAEAPTEEERLKHLEGAAEARKDLQDLVGYDIVNHDKLLILAEMIWRDLPPKQRARFTSKEWQAAIYDKCQDALLKAEKKLAEHSPDPRLLQAKIKILRSSFARQVVRAMQEISLYYQDYLTKMDSRLPRK